jgi:hypothetical protein
LARHWACALVGAGVALDASRSPGLFRRASINRLSLSYAYRWSRPERLAPVRVSSSHSRLPAASCLYVNSMYGGIVG